MWDCWDACMHPAGRAPSGYDIIIWYHLAALHARSPYTSFHSQDWQKLKTTRAGTDASWVFICSTLCMNTKTTKHTPIVNSSCLTSCFHHITLSYLRSAESSISSLIMAQSKNSQSWPNNRSQQQATCHRNHPHCRCVQCITDRNLNGQNSSTPASLGHCNPQDVMDTIEYHWKILSTNVKHFLLKTHYVEMEVDGGVGQ